MMIVTIIKSCTYKKVCNKTKLMFKNYKDCLTNSKAVYRSQERIKSYSDYVYTEKVNKISLSSNDDKRLQTFDKITTHPYGINTLKVCESEMLNSNRLIF